MTDLVVREYGVGTEPLIALHGGPAAAGDLAPLARELGKRWRVFEPLQRGSGSRLLTVATHVQDLDDVIRERCGGRPPVLIGHSWGAMLALAYAAEHPTTPFALVLIGCGTFSVTARAEYEACVEARLTAADRAAIAYLRDHETDADRRQAALGRLMRRVYGHDIEDGPDDAVAIDAVAHEETWADMMRLQRAGIYPAAFAAIGVPVLMLHGDADPHPGRLIADDLRRYIPHLEFHELPQCGHSPWLERQTSRAFFDTLDAWLSARLRPGGAKVSRMNDYASIADLYDTCVTDTGDHAFWSRRATEAAGPILELTAGTGRATIALLHAGNQPVVALDLVPAMLRRLVTRLRHTLRPAGAVAGNMTHLPFSREQFGLVVIPFNSFSELTEAPDRAAALREVRRVLAPAGRAVVTLHDPVRRRQTLDGDVRRLGPFPAGDRRVEVLVRGRLVAPDLAESEQTYRVLGDGDQVLEERRLTVRFALPDVVSFLGMATDAGLGAKALFGDYDESPYVQGASPFILAVLGRI